MAQEDATLVVGVEDQLSRGVNSMLRSLDRYRVEIGKDTKATAQFEAAALSLQNSLNKSASGGTSQLATSTGKLEQRLVGARQAAAQYRAEMAKVGAIGTNSVGQAVNAKGQFIGAADVANYQNAQRALAGVNQQITSINREIYQKNPLQAALPVGFERVAKSAQQAGDAVGRVVSPSARYALYDASRNVALLGAGLLALALVPAKVAIDFERDFANVARTVNGAGEEIKAQLISLSEQIPVTFKDITDIAALGGQLGIEKDSIVDFTTVVAKLTATTNLSAEAAGTALGRFQSLFGLRGDQLELLASSILRVGVTSVATETQITNIATQIAGIGRFAGLTVPQVVGLAGALASIGIAPELARGTITRIFSQMNLAVSKGGTTLQGFAKIAGVSADEFAASFGTERFGPLFDQFVKGLSDTALTGGNAVLALNDLGITSVRDIPLLLRMSQAFDVVTSANKNATIGWKSAATLNEQYNKIADTTAAKVQVLGNSFQGLLASMGGGTTGPFKAVVEGLTDMLRSFTELNNNPVSATVLGIGAVFLALAGVLTLVFAGGLRATAGIIGLIQSLNALNAEGGVSIGILGVLKQQLIDAGGAGALAARGIGALQLATKGVFFGALVIGAFQATGALARFFDQVQKTNLDVDKLAKGGKTAAAEIDRLFNKAAGNASDQRQIGFQNPINSVAVRTTGVNGEFTKQGGALKGLNDLLGGLPGEFSGLTEAREAVDKTDAALAKLVKSGNAQAASQIMGHLLAEAAQGGAVKLSDFTANFVKYNAALAANQKSAAAGAAANKMLSESLAGNIDIVKTLNDLTGLDSKAQDKYAQAYQKSVQSLTDFNEVTKTVQTSLEGQAEAQAKATGGDATSFYDGQTVSLQQFTDQLNTNNTAQQTWASNLLTISAQYGPEIAQTFIDAGYSAVSSSILQQLVDATPEQAQNYINAQVEAANLASQATAQALLASGHIVDGAGNTIGKNTADQLAAGLKLGLPVEYLMQQLGLRFKNNAPGVYVNTDPATSAINSLIRTNDGRTITLRVNTAAGNIAQFATSGGQAVPWATGGYTGPGGKWTPAGTVHKGEFVMTKEATARIGVSNLYALMNGRRGAQSSAPRLGYAGGGAVNLPSGGFSSIDAQSLQAIMALANRPIILYTNDKLIAEAASRGNTELAYGGGN